MAEQWHIRGDGNVVEIRSTHNRVVATGLWRKDAERIVATLRAAQQQPAGSDRMRAERLWQAISNALYDYDHGDELSAVDRLRSALAATQRTKTP
jgi:hypothetical protein